MKLTILGCGTSGGVPKIPEYWGACDPNNPKNRRSRASVLVQNADTALVIDTSPDFRDQMLQAGVQHLDGVFYTHDHADHVHGIDDLRGFYHQTRKPIPIFGHKETLKVIGKRFEYIFKDQTGYPALCTANSLNGPETVGDITMIPFEQGHGSGTSLGYRFGDIAYSTDLDRMTDEGFAALRGIKIWIVDALRYDPHPTHSHLARTLDWIAKVKPERAILTHMNWDMDYKTLVSKLPEGVEPAFDGMIISN